MGISLHLQSPVFNIYGYIISFCVLDSDRLTYLVKHFSGMCSRNAETCPRLSDGRRWEADGHYADISF